MLKRSQVFRTILCLFLPTKAECFPCRLHIVPCMFDSKAKNNNKKKKAFQLVPASLQSGSLHFLTQSSAVSCGRSVLCTQLSDALRCMSIPVPGSHVQRRGCPSCLSSSAVPLGGCCDFCPRCLFLLSGQGNAVVSSKCMCSALQRCEFRCNT